MKTREFKTECRISNMMKADGNFSDDDKRKIYYALEKLIILKKGFIEPVMRMNEQTFGLKSEEYMEKMQWINDFMKSKGIEEPIFTDISSYKVSSDDYDYYYEFKTPTQYREEEEARRAKKLGTKPAGEGREPADE